MAQTGGGAAKPRSLFDPKDKLKILSLVVGKGTGNLVEIGGQSIDLHPFTTSDGAEVLSLIDQFADLFDRAGNGGISEGSVVRTICTEGRRVTAICRKLLHDSAFVDGDEQEAIFDEWFARLPLIDTVQKLLPVLMKANGFEALAKNARGLMQTREATVEIPSP